MMSLLLQQVRPCSPNGEKTNDRDDRCAKRDLWGPSLADIPLYKKNGAGLQLALARRARRGLLLLRKLLRTVVRCTAAVSRNGR